MLSVTEIFIAHTDFFLKILKIRTPEKAAVITLKFEQGGFTVE